uniref:uncharacterized protein LOC100186987 n=1 Tax=Ciona intestinalis TaxID=7719 RepID=UPI000180BE87|nr:uncharacterized protein LOC100186987 [Ciona intestinalis]|eukprot:XP_018670386.1 uncharacterized protein LOC100186987 [Ciona intestinalis]
MYIVVVLHIYIFLQMNNSAVFLLTLVGLLVLVETALSFKQKDAWPYKQKADAWPYKQKADAWPYKQKADAWPYKQKADAWAYKQNADSDAMESLSQEMENEDAELSELMLGLEQLPL